MRSRRLLRETDRQKRTFTGRIRSSPTRSISMSPSRLALAIAAASALLCGCAARAGQMLPAGGPALLARGVPQALGVAGTYDGTIVEVENGQTHTANVTIAIKQSGKSISGTFVIEFQQGNIEL